MNHHHELERVGRRAFLKDGTLLLCAAGVSTSASVLEATQCRTSTPCLASGDALQVGLITDLHYADKNPAGTRHYRETLKKIDEAGRAFAKHKPAFVVELGDLIDAADSVPTELAYLKTINKKFSAVAKQRHYVLGNHCVDTLTKQEFLGAVGREKSFYSFDEAGVHFVILDSCFRSDGKPYQRKNFRWTDANIPQHELDWLTEDLKANQKPTIVFAHQRLDVQNNHGVRNNAQVRRILESSGNVQAVFQGHSHQNDLKEIGGIHYCTLVAMVEGSGDENNGYSVLTVRANGDLQVDGFRKQKDRLFKS